MKSNLLKIVSLFLLISLSMNVYSIKVKKVVAATPPMGWNSWTVYLTDVNEAQVKANAEVISGKLQKFGWEYVVIDMGWFLTEGYTCKNMYANVLGVNLDEFGRHLPAINKFPSSVNNHGFKPLADYLHAKGLKFGIHILRGIPREAVRRNTPVKGTNYTARDIVNFKDTCSWYAAYYGIDANKAGAQEYYNSIIELYNQWGVDFIKIDDSASPYHEDELALVAKAIKNFSRPIVLSLSPGPTPPDKLSHLLQTANMWRVATDFWDEWRCVTYLFDVCQKWQGKATEGHWPDCCLLPLGKLRVTGNDPNWGGEINANCRFTDEEKKTVLSLYSIFRSPLMLSFDLTQADENLLKMFMNKELINLNQHSKNNRQILNIPNGEIIWTADASDGNWKYLAIFNSSSGKELKISFPLQKIGLNKNSFKIYDIWTQKDIDLSDNTYSIVLKPHYCNLIKIKI